jgi:hypothetical protein
VDAKTGVTYNALKDMDQEIFTLFATFDENLRCLHLPPSPLQVESFMPFLTFYHRDLSSLGHFTTSSPYNASNFDQFLGPDSGVDPSNAAFLGIFSQLSAFIQYIFSN